MRNIILTGFMGTGKSSVGKALARMTGMEFIDLDAIIMAVAGQTINDIFSLQEESFSRTLETAEMRKIALRDNILLSTGGGAVLAAETGRSSGARGRSSTYSPNQRHLQPTVKCY